MLAVNPTIRPNARRCAERVEEYLDGDRDVERRRSMATELVWTARNDFTAGHGSEAMRAASRALALDPQVEGAAEIVTRMMLEPPRDPPAELRAALRQADSADVARHAKAAIPGYVLMASFLPIIVLNGVLSWPVVLSAVGIALGMAVAARALRDRPERSFDWMVIYGIGNAAAVAMLGRIVGEITVVPALLSFITASVITYPMFLERPAVLGGIMLGGLFLPLVLELIGIIPPTFQLREGGILMKSNAMDFGGKAAVATLLLASTATIVNSAIQSTVLGRANRAAQHKLVIQAWHLSQLLPTQTRPLTQAS
jgi:serine/threonine-protein kinase